MSIVLLSYFTISVIVYWLGLWSVPRAEALLGSRRDYKGRWRDHDQNQIVIDEVLGMLVACFPLVFLPLSLKTIPFMLLAFVLFSVFDIIKKPYPISYFDHIHTPEGVMLDDVMAGGWAAICISCGLLLTKFV